MNPAVAVRSFFGGEKIGAPGEVKNDVDADHDSLEGRFIAEVRLHGFDLRWEHRFPGARAIKNPHVPIASQKTGAKVSTQKSRSAKHKRTHGKANGFYLTRPYVSYPPSVADVTLSPSQSGGTRTTARSACPRQSPPEHGDHSTKAIEYLMNL